MTKHVLDYDFDYDFDLVGISCHLRDYRLCWTLNQQLELNMERAADAANNGHAEFPVFRSYCEDTRTTVQLFVNRSDEGYLIPEQRQADYLLMVQDNVRWEMDDLLDILRSNPHVLMAFEIDAASLKSRELLLINE